eukprot:scaffold5398_cov240-Ochromonas_danica.AAC.1
MFLKIRTHQVQRCFKSTLIRTFTATDPIHTKQTVHFRTKIAMILGSIVAGTAFYFSHKDDLAVSTADSVFSAFYQGRGFNVDSDKKATIVREDLNKKLLAYSNPRKSISMRLWWVREGLASPQRCARSSPPLASQETIGLKDEIVGGVRRYLSGHSKEEKESDMNYEPLATHSKRLRNALLEAASAFKKKHKRPLVLVIDSADRLAEKEPEFLEIFQDFAKDCACEGTLRIVFIFRDGSALPLLQGCSAWSRAEEPLEVGEISDEDAVKYLVSKSVPEPNAKRAVNELTGGLFMELNKYVQVHSTKTIEALIEDKNDVIVKVLKELQLPVSHPLFVKINQGKVIRAGKALDYDVNNEQIGLLLAANILAAHPSTSTYTYTFHDRHTANFFARMLKE